MFRIRAISDCNLPFNLQEIEKVQQTLRERFPGISEEEIQALPDKLRDPLAHRFRTSLLVADDLRGNLRGFALLCYAPDLRFWLLDFIATIKTMTGSGVGGALYNRVKDLARSQDSSGLFFECLPDDPAACSDAEVAKQNAARLRFYERFGARPIIGTAYETPLEPGELDMPHLVHDDLGSGRPLQRDEARGIVRAILERKYADLCTPEYVDQVVASFVDDPVRIRPPHYAKAAQPVPRTPDTSEGMIVLVVNDRNEIHHVRERGYVEAPARINHILKGIEPTGLFWRVPVREYPESHIRAVHDDRFVDYLKRICQKLSTKRSVYPYVFPIRNKARLPKDPTYAAGYYCIDTFTPLNQNAYLAAKRAVDCALTAADVLLTEHPLAYALVRPPGHHAERAAFGGFCYFNNAAVAGHYLARIGRVAILDIDFHHGNGQQDIFLARDDVFTVSIHGHPRYAYPFFSGYADEIGIGPGEGFNLNFPLPEDTDASRYREALGRALKRIERFAPRFLVVALGLDTAKGDPTGTWSLRAADFEENGRMVGAMGLHTLVVQEGGYRSSSLPANARAFFQGLHKGMNAPGAQR